MSSTSSTMKAVQMSRSSPETTPTLSLVEVPIPSPKHGEVLVKIHASLINPSDLINVKGGVRTCHIPQFHDYFFCFSTTVQWTIQPKLESNIHSSHTRPTPASPAATSPVRSLHPLPPPRHSKPAPASSAPPATRSLSLRMASMPNTSSCPKHSSRPRRTVYPTSRPLPSACHTRPPGRA